MLTPMATTTSSKSPAARPTMSRWPLVTGSKDPGQTARRMRDSLRGGAPERVWSGCRGGVTVPKRGLAVALRAVRHDPVRPGHLTALGGALHDHQRTGHQPAVGDERGRTPVLLHHRHHARTPRPGLEADRAGAGVEVEEAQAVERPGARLDRREQGLAHTVAGGPG